MKSNAGIVLFLLIFLSGALFGYMIYERLNPLPPRAPVVADTLFIELPQKPDTVVLERVKYLYKTIVKDTVLRKTDTVYVDRYKDVYRSEKHFRFPYVQSEVIAWSAAPVDSFQNKIVVSWDAHYSEVIYPQMRFQLGVQRRHGRWEGFLLGLATAGGLVWLTK
jgi:hypothetical protein